MKRVRTFVLGLVASAGLVQAAMAADLGSGPARDDSQVPYNGLRWTGFYFGTHLGYGWSDVETSASSSSQDGSGVVAGGQIGFNRQYGRLVYGIEADISATSIDGGSACCGHTINSLASVRGRAGMTASFDNRTLFYVTAGAAWADVEFSSISTSSSDTLFGWVAGAGIERAISPNLSARAEYLYYGFDDVSAPAGTLGIGATNLDLSTHTVRFGLNYKY